VRAAGTGLTAEALPGVWLLDRVWSRRAAGERPMAGWLLRRLGARLEVIPAPAGAGAAVGLVNSVALGGLLLRFEGTGTLSGPRPLLRFGFDRLQLRLGSRTIWQRPLPRPDPRRQPFFALIGGGRRSGWLAARGRGGGLARWRLAADPPEPGDQAARSSASR
jgi:hypothetical protein